MGKISNPIRFSEHYGIDPKGLDDRGILDPTMNADTSRLLKNTGLDAVSRT